MNARYVTRVIPSIAARDGAGVSLHRSLGQQASFRLDPFLMLDEFVSDRPEDYIAGFPSHPHRGFETVTYMLEGHMLHEDHLGNKGHLRQGDVQWMTAGRGIIHSEMPQQQEGLLHGFQLWINLPAREKMKPASYRDIPSKEVPVLECVSGIRIKVIAGEAQAIQYGAEQVPQGAIHGLSTAPIYWDVWLPIGQTLTVPLPLTHQAFIYPYEGSVWVSHEATPQKIEPRQAAILSEGSEVVMTAKDQTARFLLLAGYPINEPIVQRGPFVMNTMQEIEQAIYDYQHGQL